MHEVNEFCIELLKIAIQITKKRKKEEFMETYHYIKARLDEPNPDTSEKDQGAS